MRYHSLKNEAFFGSFHINYDLANLISMIKKMSLILSTKARERLRWMDYYRECNNAALTVRHFGISLRTFFRWKKKYDPWDLRSLEEKSRKPRSSPKRISKVIELRVCLLKREHPRWGMAKMALLLKKKEGISLSAMTVWRICKKRSLIMRYKTRKRKSPKPRINWAEVHIPGDLLEMDTKHITLHGRRLYQYTMIDVISRVRHAEIYPHATMKTTVQFLESAKEKYSFSFQKIQTDNGSEFGKEVSRWCAERKIQHVFSHKRRPQENGHVERSHRIDEEEFYSVGNLGGNVTDLRERFGQYLKMYNEERPHWALGGKTPLEALQSYSLTKETVPHVLT